MDQNENKKDDENQFDELLGHDFDEDINIPPTDETLARLKGIAFDKQYQVPPDCITPVKKQCVTNCWTFATTCMIESHLLQKGWTSKTDALDNTFSETHMTYSAFDIRGGSPTPVNPEGRTPKPPKPSAPTPRYGYGGTRVSALSYCAKRRNSVPEAIDPNFLKDSAAQLPTRDNALTLLKYRRFIVTQAYFIEDPVVPGDPTFIESIKFAVKQYGPVYIGFLLDKEKFKIVNYKAFGDTRSYYLDSLPPRGSEDYPGGHALTIVGWDDEFNDFTTPAPKRPGAFRIKNSWGTGGKKGDGYVWISYENVGFKGPFCITEMREDKDERPIAVETHSNFGMMQNYPPSPGETKVAFEDSFTTATDNEEIYAIGLCCLTPCLATVSVSIAGGTRSTLLDKAYLRLPGYTLFELPSTQIQAKGTSYTITVTYKSVGLSSVFVPLEYKRKRGYDNLDLSTVSGSIKLGSTGVSKTIKEINAASTTPGKYGNIAMYLFTRGQSTEANNIFLAHQSLTIPAPTEAGRVDNLPQSVQPTGATAAVAVDWRLEPYDYKKYNPGYTTSVSMYKTASALGMVNTGSVVVKAFTTAVLGSGKYAMKRLFISDIPSLNKKYTAFTVSTVSNGNEVTLNGEFPIADANIRITCNNSSATTTTNSSGKWSLEKFPLYNVISDGWQDSYENSTIKISITDDKKLLFCEAQYNVKLSRPFDVTGLTVAVIVGMGTVGLIAGLMYGCGNGCTTLQLAAGTYTILAAGVAVGDTRNIALTSKGPAEIITDGAFCEGLRGIENIDITINHFKVDGQRSEQNSGKFWGFIKTLTKGGYARNCNVKLNISGADQFGGIFYSGEDITVSRCTVIANISNAGCCGAIAHTITGNSTIEACSVSGNITADMVAGLAVNASGSIKNCSVNLQATAKTQVAGVCLTGSGAIEKILAQGKYATSESNAMAAGIACTMNSGSIKNCRVSAAVTGTDAGTNNCAGGVACAMTDAIIQNCITGGALGAATAFGIAPGVKGKPNSVALCASFYPVIHGKTAYRISREASDNCIAYDTTQCDSGVTFISSGEKLKDAEALLKQDTYAALQFDFANSWVFVPKKLFPALKAFTGLLYDYPFPNPYATKSGKYCFPVGTPLALYGAASPQASKLSWRNLSPLQGGKTHGNPGFEFMTQTDEFYLQLHLSFDIPGQYTVEIISIVENYSFGKTIAIEITN